MSTKRTDGSPLEVFLVFLKLGFTSFGGPIAHIGYFRNEFVERRAWLTDREFGQLFALSQFLPGPASSQLGFSLGLLRAGWPGALSAFLAFTLPSAFLLLLFALSLPYLEGQAGDAAIAGLKLVACIVVADAVIGMTKSLCPDLERRLIAVLVLVVLLFMGSVEAQILVVCAAGVIGAFFLRSPTSGHNASSFPLQSSKKAGVFLLLVFFTLLAVLPMLGEKHQVVSLMNVFYRAGALVFGGGHVVLPLLYESLVPSSIVTNQQFLAGYGAAQAVPGPLFTISAYLGAVADTDAHFLTIAAACLVSVFLPGFLLMAGVLPWWAKLSQNALGQRALNGVNAAVVGLLAAALYDPIITSGVGSLLDVIVVSLGLTLLTVKRVPILLIVVACVLIKVVFSLVGAT